MKLFDTIEEAEKAIAHTTNSKEWNSTHRKEFELFVAQYSLNPPKYYIAMHRKPLYSSVLGRR